MNGTFDHWQLALIQCQEVTQDSNHRPDFHDFFLQMVVCFVRNDLYWMPLGIRKNYVAILDFLSWSTKHFGQMVVVQILVIYKKKI